MFMKVAAIVPAYNEESTIGTVVSTLTSSPLIHEVLVVDDGSQDLTPIIAKEAGARVITLDQNVGKGGAMKIGAESTDADVLLFIDADLIGFNHNHIADLLRPILTQKAEMTVGIFAHGRFATDFAQKVAPFLSGQRAVTRNLFLQIPDIENTRYGVEVALSRYVSKHNIPVVNVSLLDLSQVMKEEKRGLIKGFCQRLRMYWEILRAVRL